MADANLLPEETILEILKRLPAKSLLRFRCVCKSWSSLITSPNFIISCVNQNNTSENNTYILLRIYSETHKKEIYTLHCDNPTIDLRTHLDFPFTSFNPYFRIVGSCNGLICLADTLYTHKNDIVLWNPSIRKFLSLPEPSIRYDKAWVFMSVLGFGFDSRKNDYKVVRIAGDGSKIVPPRVEVYELGSGAWRVIDAIVPPYEMHHCWLQANLNGIVHWLAFNPCQMGGFQSLIVAFDVSDEVFREIMLPPSLGSENLLNLSLTVYGDSLALCHYSQGTQHRRACSIWVMKEYGVATWFEIFTIELQQGVGLVLRFLKNGEVVLATGEGELVSYNPKKQQVKSLGIFGSSHPLILHTGSFYVDTYVESLVLLDRVSGYEPTHLLLAE
ncbi:F-box protein At3g07870-like [Actinidia eriantha]|uniref:F-box protein At3g07870-like n=1 Tax=Actinidia eriantha TaxID=165200 RepID=UPI00258FFC88|nr:F-box protein At3g07870-like [Actinidia eriantha]